MLQVAHAYGYMLQQCYKFTAHATGDNGRRNWVTSSYKLLMLLVIIVASLIQVTQATGDDVRRSCVTSLYKLLMLLVIIVSEVAFHVYTRCSCYWLHATEAVTSLLLMLPVIIVAEAVLLIYTSCSCYLRSFSWKLCYEFKQAAHATDDYCR